MPKINVGGLKPTFKKRTDYSFHKSKKKLYAAFNPATLPSEYLLLSTIQQQGPNPTCTGVTDAAIKESTFGVPFSPDWHYMKEAVIANEVSLEGYDLRTSMAVGCRFGALPLVKAPFTAQTKEIDFFADPKNWPNLDSDAESFKEPAYFAVTGPYDIYDSIRAAMYLDQEHKRTISVGVLWQDEWSHAENGVIPLIFDSPIGLHNVKIAGWTWRMIDGTALPALPKNEPYLVIQNSWGKDFGDSGLFYLSRAVANKILKEGAFKYSSTVADVKTISQYQDILNAIKKILQSILLTFVKKTPEPPTPVPNGPVVTPDSPKPIPPPKMETMKEMSRRVCMEEGLDTPTMSRLLTTIQCESGFNPKAVQYNRATATDVAKNPNLKIGQILSTDYGICQFNDYYYIGKVKALPTVQFVLNNPEVCVCVMAREFKAGNASRWSCYKKLYG